MSDDEFTATGHCVCGAVAFTVKGKKMFSVLCHCRACSRARGMSPVHLVGFPVEAFEYERGEDMVNIGSGLGKMLHAFCSSCGTGLYQCPEGAGFRAVYPTNFHMSCSTDNEKEVLLPPCLLPATHINYENRLFDWHDPLPKFQVWNNGVRMTNTGEVIAEDSSA